MANDASEETALTSVTGRYPFSKSYTSQDTVPVNIKAYMGNDKSPVDFVLTVFITCGKKAVVVKNAAVNTITFTKCIRKTLILISVNSIPNHLQEGGSQRMAYSSKLFLQSIFFNFPV
jgi:hypothetical protein